MGNSRTQEGTLNLRDFIDSQLATWPLAADNFRKLAQVVTRRIATSDGCISLQHNPARAVSTGADTTATAIASRPCFLCRTNRPGQQQALTFAGKYEILVNPFPIFPDHLTIAAIDHAPQRIRNRISDMLSMACRMDGFTVFYNGPACGASAPDHAHFQAVPSACLPIWEKLPDRQSKPVEIHDILPPCISIVTSTAEDAEKHTRHVLSCLPTDTDTGEPKVNILTRFTGNRHHIIIIPRRRHRPTCFGRDNDLRTRMISPASIDMAGMIVVPRRSDFEAITSQEAEDIITETGMPAEEIRKLMTPTLKIGIVEAEELTISFSVPYTDNSGNSISGTVRFTNLDAPLRLIPSDTDATFTIRDVTIGIDFHWQRHENQTFRGALSLIPDNGRILAVNEIDVESYLCSVVSSEMNASAPEEFLKAHAVISRSWVLAQINRQTGSQEYPCSVTDDEIIRWTDHSAHSLFDVCADDHCQRYQGCTRVTSEAAIRAVEATRGLVLTFDGQLCDTRFSKCCGGITEQFSTCWQPVDYPYLQSVTDTPEAISADISSEEAATRWISTMPDAFCANPPAEVLETVLNDYDRSTPHLYRWTVEYTADELAAIGKRRTGTDFGQIRDIRPLHRGPSGRIDRLMLAGTKAARIIGKELEIRRTLSESHLYSSAFIAEGSDRNEAGVPRRWVIRGAGWGHGVGLCQIGAAVMASRGYSYREILAHYFTRSELTELYR